MKISKPRTHSAASRDTKANATPLALAEDTLTCIGCDLNKILHIAGYDKPLTANRETMHVKNLTADTIVSGIKLEITYLDSRNRELHSREIWINATIEPEQTQLVTFPTWDIQRSFYYRRSVKPRRQSTPYDVKIEIKAITVSKY